MAGSRAVAAGRHELESAGDRLRAGAWSVGQCALAAGVAWAAAGAVFDHERPFFACVAAVVCLGVRAQQRLRRVAELAVGVTVGVLIGDLLVGVIGTGAWQISLVVGVALLLAVALDGGPLLVAQSGLQAVFVVGLPRMPGGELARWEDAMLGGVTALAVAALLPADPWRAARRSGQALTREIATALDCASRAAAERDAHEAVEALARMRGTQAPLDAWLDALGAGREISRLSPLRRDRGSVHAGQRRLSASLDRAVRNLRVLARRLLFAVETGEQLPDGLADLLSDLAHIVQALGADLGDADGLTGRQLSTYARRLDPEALHATGLSAAVVVAQLRSAVVDLLEGLGSTPQQARAALPALG